MSVLVLIQPGHDPNPNSGASTTKSSDQTSGYKDMECGFAGGQSRSLCRRLRGTSVNNMRVTSLRLPVGNSPFYGVCVGWPNSNTEYRPHWRPWEGYLTILDWGLDSSAGGLRRSHGQQKGHLLVWDWEQPPCSDPGWCSMIGLGAGKACP